MIKKALAILAIIVMLGCNVEAREYTKSKDNCGFILIDSRLAYDKDTKIIYYFMWEKGVAYIGYGYLAPYISSNGKYCIYNNGIEEVK